VVQAKTTILISGGTSLRQKPHAESAYRGSFPRKSGLSPSRTRAELHPAAAARGEVRTRPPNLNKEAASISRQLLRTALRMRPDLIIVGECRGAEALDMLQAMTPASSRVDEHGARQHVAQGRLLRWRRLF